MRPLRYMRYEELAGTPNVVVDGSSGPDTRLVLSHWPGSPTPDFVRDDLSAQIALRALDHPELFDGIEAVSNNHFDQDGLMSVYALTEPDGATARRDRVIDVTARRRLRVVRVARFGTHRDGHRRARGSRDLPARRGDVRR